MSTSSAEFYTVNPNQEPFPQADNPRFNQAAQDIFDRLVLLGAKVWTSWRFEDIEETANFALLASVKQLPKLDGITRDGFFWYNFIALKHGLFDERKAVQRTFERSIVQLHESAEFIEMQQAFSSAVHVALSELRDAVPALPAEQRKVVQDWLERRTFVEIAEIMKVSDRTVRRRYDEAVKNLRTYLS